MTVVKENPCLLILAQSQGPKLRLLQGVAGTLGIPQSTFFAETELLAAIAETRPVIMIAYRSCSKAFLASALSIGHVVIVAEKAEIDDLYGKLGDRLWQAASVITSNSSGIGDLRIARNALRNILLPLGERTWLSHCHWGAVTKAIPAGPAASYQLAWEQFCSAFVLTEKVKIRGNQVINSLMSWSGSLAPISGQTTTDGSIVALQARCQLPTDSDFLAAANDLASRLEALGQEYVVIEGLSEGIILITSIITLVEPHSSTNQPISPTVIAREFSKYCDRVERELAQGNGIKRVG